MGTVYKAKRCDGSYNQTVGVKVGSAMGLKCDFLNRERQVLADLSHPVITKILDMGHSVFSTIKENSYDKANQVNAQSPKLITRFETWDQHQNGGKQGVLVFAIFACCFV